LAILQAFERTQKNGAVRLMEEPEMFLHPQTRLCVGRGHPWAGFFLDSETSGGPGRDRTDDLFHAISHFRP
jgi:hypothetical protein